MKELDKKKAEREALKAQLRKTLKTASDNKKEEIIFLLKRL